MKMRLWTKGSARLLVASAVALVSVSASAAETLRQCECPGVNVPGVRAADGVIDSVIYQVADKMPEFPGGNSALAAYIGQNIKYPAVAVENGIEGRVMVSFVVRKDGSVSDVAVIGSVSPELDKAAVNVVKGMPHWTPGMVKGQNVSVRMTLPVIFKLNQKGADGQSQALKPAYVAASYPGGDVAMAKYINGKLVYPKKAVKDGVEGRVVVSFVVNVDGSLTDATVTRSVRKDLDKEALRVVEDMPKWEPATRDGKPVSSTFSVPVTFKLNSK